MAAEVAKSQKLCGGGRVSRRRLALFSELNIKKGVKDIQKESTVLKMQLVLYFFMFIPNNVLSDYKLIRYACLVIQITMTSKKFI
ncbi:MAG: hypothetical protein K5769_05585 [Pseudobutyrivibrio sp.]|nr:hypothetical protein [Pseudobutyrivibrio sp.]